ncbi:RNA polymerase sigma factor [Gaoshiqia sediminis]|uniref:Sigma-70 family RNA polymerase sigma factor n=1 Tax=Gaoshiqia sediminis TaxID=2986998 RepID=A0AA42C5T8_9BACT|nr:sigma-70 family RNA polymerase sigma factor [Gaoshiqia sediminis]MCW0483213.1 sigma-70 family RNA polymerase sigma factor [Gaoshiqia sediminis]
MIEHSKGNDHELWTKFLHGNDQVLSLIYLRYVNALYDYGSKITPDHSLVKDCIQDVFCTIIRNRQSLSPTDNIQLYLFKALKRQLVREIQKSLKYREIDPDNSGRFEISFLQSFDHTEFELSDEQKKALISAIESLTARQKEAIYLRFTRGMDYKEIAVILNLNYQSARALIHRAISKLREILAGKTNYFSQILLCIFRKTGKGVLQQ